jgi:hypothetical protein
MVLRVSASLLLLVTFSCMVTLSPGLAGGPPAACPAPPSPCDPSPCAPPCGPPPCGAANPFGPLGGCLGICQGLLGACIQIPAMIMGGILSPPRSGYPSCAPPSCAPACAPPSCAPMCAPPTYCAPPSCGPSYCPPMYAPMPAQPARISKCKPYAYVPRYDRETSDGEPSTAIGFTSSWRTAGAQLQSPETVLCSATTQKPFILSSGRLMRADSADSGESLYAGSSGVRVPSVFADRW